MSGKKAALHEIVEIARLNGLSASDIIEALDKPTGGEGGSEGSIIRRMLAFIGGNFVFAGVIVYIGMFWEDMNSAARIIITLCTGIVALVIAILLLDHDRFASAATPLFLIAAWLQSTGIMVAFDELGAGGDPQHALLATTTLMWMQQLLVFNCIQLPVLLFIVLFFVTLTFVNAFDLMEVDGEVNVLIVGLSLLLPSFGIDKTRQRSITPFWFFAGGAAFLWGAFELIEDTPFHPLYLGLTAFMIYLSTVARIRSLLFVSTLAMIGHLGYFTAEYFVDSIGWPVALIFMGLVLIGLSNMALRINRKYIAGS